MQTNDGTKMIEEGAAFLEIARRRAVVSDRRERFDVVVIGAGQAGLSVGYHLRRANQKFVILDAAARVGDTWRQRWDSLRLFTPARFDGLDGMKFPGDPDVFPTKDEMGDFLEWYAAHFELPVRCGVRVSRLSRADGRFTIECTGGVIEADQVVIAMANYQVPKVPSFAAELDPAIRQIHSFHYRSPTQLRDGAVLIVGAGNSGAEIAKELVRNHAVWMVGRDTGQVPFRMDGLPGRLLLARLVLRGVFHRVLTVRTPMGRRVRSKVLHKGGPLIRVKKAELMAAGVQRAGRVVGVENGFPKLDDGRVLDVSNIVWCTGFEPGFSWIDLPIFDDHGEPRHVSGAVPDAPGLWFVGLHFLHAMSSTMIHGVGRDAARIAAGVARMRASTRQSA